MRARTEGMHGRARRVGLTAAVLVLSLLPASLASAAVVADRACFREGATASFVGTGFAPGQLVAITLDSQQIGQSRADATGTVAGRIPSLAPISTSKRRRALTMSLVSNPGVAAAAAFTETKVYVVTKPRRFRPGRRLRIRAGGFYGAGPTMYAHVRGPRKRNIRIGSVVGPCGEVSATRRVLLRRRDPVGLYPTQFDTVRTYRGRAVPIGFRRLYGIQRVFRSSGGGALLAPPLGPERWLAGD